MPGNMENSAVATEHWKDKNPFKFPSQSQRKAMSKNVQTALTNALISYTSKIMLQIL